jgi:hypothetical protein
MEIMMIRPVICQPMNQPWITVEVENGGLILGEKTVEIPIRKTMRMLRGRLETEEIDDVNKAKAETGKFVPQQNARGQ